VVARKDLLFDDQWFNTFPEQEHRAGCSPRSATDNCYVRSHFPTQKKPYEAGDSRSCQNNPAGGQGARKDHVGSVAGLIESVNPMVCFETRFLICGFAQLSKHEQVFEDRMIGGEMRACRI
jgi:hypothetical protein